MRADEAGTGAGDGVGAAGRPFPPWFTAAVARLARGIAAELATARTGTAKAAAETTGTGTGTDMGTDMGTRADGRVLVVGVPDRHLRAALGGALGPLRVVVAPAGPPLDEPDGAYDVAVALDWLHRLEDPGAGLAELRRVAPAHRLVAAPREPLAALGVRPVAGLVDRLRGARRPRPSLPRPSGSGSWSAPGFLRFASRSGAVRDVAHPLGWSVVWLRRR